jgi:hypothetical protein
MNTEERKRYQREWAAKRRQAAKGVDKVVETVDEPVVDAVVVDVEGRDRKRFPDRVAWDIALDRAMRAMDYAAMFPEHVRPSERVFGTVEWQYENEGLPAVRKMAI